MIRLNYGLKLIKLTEELIKAAQELCKQGLFDFLEIYVEPSTFKKNKAALKCIDFPTVIHSPHLSDGFNISIGGLSQTNLDRFNEVLQYADATCADYIIIHPGVGGNLESVNAFLAHANDERILIENLPKFCINGYQSPSMTFPKSLKKILPKPIKQFGKSFLQSGSKKSTFDHQWCRGYFPKSIKQLMNAHDVGFCLDFGHAYKAAASLGINANQLINDFMSLGPTLFHLSDGISTEELDWHLALGDGDYDLKFLRCCIERNPSNYVTLETPRNNPDSFKEDINNRMKFEKSK